MSIAIGRALRRIRRTAKPCSGEENLAQTQSLDSIENPHRLASELMRLDRRREQRSYPPYLRCSGLHEVCPREYVLGWRNNLKFTPYTDASMLFTFEIGHAVHERLQNNPRFFGDDLLGWWRCSCGFLRFGRRQKQRCPKCGGLAEMFRYEEHAMKIKDPFRLTGHMDGLLEVDPGDVRIADFKTINGDDFDKLVRPHADHVMQVHGYMMALDYDENMPIKVNARKALLIYYSKQHKTKCSPVKAFHVTRVAHVEDTLRAMLIGHRQAIQDPARLCPPLETCVASNFSDYRSKHCPALALCKAALVA